MEVRNCDKGFNGAKKTFLAPPRESLPALWSGGAKDIFDLPDITVRTNGMWCCDRYYCLAFLGALPLSRTCIFAGPSSVS